MLEAAIFLEHLVHRPECRPWIQSFDAPNEKLHYRAWPVSFHTDGRRLRSIWRVSLEASFQQLLLVSLASVTSRPSLLLRSSTTSSYQTRREVKKKAGPPGQESGSAFTPRSPRRLVNDHVSVVEWMCGWQFSESYYSLSDKCTSCGKLMSFSGACRWIGPASCRCRGIDLTCSRDTFQHLIKRFAVITVHLILQNVIFRHQSRLVDCLVKAFFLDLESTILEKSSPLLPIDHGVEAQRTELE